MDSSRSGRALLGAGVVLALGLAACGAGDGAATAPIGPPGTVTAPRHPLVIDPLPAGWSVSGAELERPPELPQRMQTLYLPPESTPEAGPALAVGDFGQDDGYVACGPGRPSGLTWSSTGYAASPSVHRIGALVVVTGEMDTDQPGYVIGRDLTEDQVLDAARAARFAPPAPAVIAARGLVEGFRRVATAPVVPNSVFGEVIQLETNDGQSLIRIGAYEGDAAADQLTRFWRATMADDPCEGRRSARAHRQLGAMTVVVDGQAPQALVDRIAADLQRTDQAGFEAFRSTIDQQPASAVAYCPNRDGNVYVEGVLEDVRWVLAMPAVPGLTASSCHVYVVDRQPVGGGSGGGTGSLVGPGSYGVALLGGVTDHRQGAVKHLVGGTVPAAAERVVISIDRGESVEATLVDGGHDPSRRYFGGLLQFRPGGSAAWVQTTVVAYDSAGREIARANPVPRDDT